MSGFRQAACLLALVLMSACTTHDGDLTRAQGAGAGAALGVGLAALISGDTEAILAGAAAGGLAGLAVGDAVAHKKADYATKEDMIIRERRLVSDKADEIGAYNIGLRRQIRELDQDIAALEVRAERDDAFRDRRRHLKREALADLDHARRRLGEVNDEINISRRIYRKALRDVEPVDLIDWDRRIGELERRRNALAGLIADFEASAQRIV